LTVALLKGDALYVLETANVSGGGLCLRSNEEFPVGTHLHLVFGRPPELSRLSVNGIVRWSKSGKGVGVEFTSISPHDQQALLSFVNSQTRDQQA
jgi:Tfp pilus assembly protein PilZ